MPKINQSALRRIIDDFAKEIDIRKTSEQKPSKIVINFRKDREHSKERDIWEVPAHLLRFRKDNGRIATEILSYEKNHGPLDETTDESQKILFEALRHIDEKKNEELVNSIKHVGQDQPAIITCDGFLINGNRRRMAYQQIATEKGVSLETYKMKVVILPGKNDQGGPPTILEIEQIENRYQFQSEAKAEYYLFNRALSMRRKINNGMSIDEQLRDDPRFAGLDNKRFKQEVKKMQEEFIDPLDSIDKYLMAFGRDGLYDTISKGPADKEGRWEAFLEYSKFYRGVLTNKKAMVKLGIEDDELGIIEDTAFKLIRKRDLSDTGIKKTNLAIRDLKKWLGKKDAKKELLYISKEVDEDIDEKEKFDDNGNEYSPQVIDKIWGEKNKEVIINQVKKAMKLTDHARTKDTPLTLLEAALGKLEHECMTPDTIRLGEDQTKAIKLAESIENEAKNIRKEIYEYKKKAKQLNTNH
jgi:hypothetical protein